jgi:GTP cyclohydrolase I
VSKLVRLVQMYARRFQIQERLTAEIANALDRVLEPQGAAVVIEGTHGCMTSRGASQREETCLIEADTARCLAKPFTQEQQLSLEIARLLPDYVTRAVREFFRPGLRT